MSGWRRFIKQIKSAPKSDIAVLLITFALTVIFDLVVAIEVGVLLAAVLFMHRMSEVTRVEGWKDVDPENDPDSITLRVLPKDTIVYEISGPMFFATADKILQISPREGTKVLVLRMRSVSTIDSTAMSNLESLYEDCRSRGVQLVMSHVNEQPMHVIRKAGFDKKLGEVNFCAHIDDALARAQELTAGQVK